MPLGIDWILGVADRVVGLEGAISRVVAPGPAVLPLVALGGLIRILWQGRWRLAGVAPVALALVLWAGADQTGVPVSAVAGLVGLLGDEGRAL